MGIFRVYTGNDGHSHVETLRVGEHAAVAEAFAARDVQFHETAPPFENGFHQQPIRRVVVVLDGEIELGFNDGTVHRAGPGDATLVEDMTGSGHNFRISSDTPAVTAVIDLAD